MPKKPTRNPITFDDHLAAVVHSKREKRGITQEDLAAIAGIPYSNLRRRLLGSPMLVNELERIAAALGVEVREIVEEALKDFGGIEKLMSEANATTDELAKKRAQKTARTMTGDEIDDAYARGDAAAQRPAGDEDDDEPAAP